MRTTLVHRAAICWRLAAVAAVAAFVWPAAAQEPTLSSAISYDGLQLLPEGNANPTLGGLPPGDEYLAPIAANEDGTAGGPGAECSSCNGGGGGGYFYNRCGCSTNMFPWIRGPGNCDNWCVGPHWNVELDGMFIRRDNADWARVVNSIGTTPDLLDQFDYGPGVRLFVTGYNESNYGVQVGYEGVNDFRATALFTGQEINYESALNSVEANVIRRTTAPLKIFAGARFIDLREVYVDTNSTASTVDKFKVENQLMGFQIGALRDAWQLNKWFTLEPYGNAGMYYNGFKRQNINFAAGTTTSVNRDFSEIAFVGEAGLNAIVRVNRCVALRAGYQAIVLNGVGEGLDAAFAQGLDPTTVLYHGARFGVEYQR